MAKVKLASKTTQPNLYSIVLTMGDKSFTQTGKTIPETMGKFNIEELVDGVSAVISHGDKTCEYEYLPYRRLGQIAESEDQKALFEQNIKELLEE